MSTTTTPTMEEKETPTVCAQAEAWKVWRDGEEGRRCAAGVTSGQYLQNRLWWAFMAGYGAKEKEGENHTPS